MDGGYDGLALSLWLDGACPMLGGEMITCMRPCVSAWLVGGLCGCVFPYPALDVSLC